MNRSCLFLLASLPLVAGACTDDDPNQGLANQEPTTPSEFLTYAAEAGCQRAFECQASFDATMHADSFDSLYGASVADCVSQRMAQVRDFSGTDYLEKLDAAAAAGRVIFSSADGAACVAARLASTCDANFGQNGEAFEAPPECATTLVGAVPSAGTCSLSDECATAGDRCDDATMTCTAG